MATYKVLQDIEADDKLVGPLTLRQFLYGAIAALCLWLSFLSATKGAAFMIVILLPVAGITGFFAWPWGGEQPTELWALAKVRFYIKPRRRIWNQSGIKELVTITVPKKVDRVLTNGLSQNEVKNRLNVLANTIDSRGWAIKNVGIGGYMQPVAAFDPGSDRLISAGALPQPVPTGDIDAADDMLDVQNNPVAQQFERMITASTKAHRQKVIERMEQAGTPAPAPPPAAGPITSAQPQNDYWFLNQPTQTSSAVPRDTVTFNTQVVAPGMPTSSLPVSAAVPTADEEEFIKSHRNEPAFSPNMHGHLHVIQPLSAQKSAPQPPANSATAVMPTNQQAGPMTTPAVPAVTPATNQSSPVTEPQETGILDLARNDDLNVATIAREAGKRRESSQDEVVISLH